MKSKIFAIILIAPILQGCVTVGKQSGGLSYAPASDNEPLAVVKQLLKEPNGTVTLAVVIQSINHPALVQADRFKFEDWAKEISPKLIADWEQLFLRQCSKYRNFKLVDRTIIEKLAPKFDYPMQGYNRQIDVTEFGRHLEASHLLVIDLMRFQSGFLFTDSIQARLLRVEDASVLGVYSTAEK